MKMAVQMAVQGLDRGMESINKHVAKRPLQAYDMGWKWWYARQDSNLRPSVPKTDALSAELRAHDALILA